MTKNYIMQRIDDFIFDSNQYLHAPIRVPFQSLTLASKVIVIESLSSKIDFIRKNFSNTFGVRLTLYRAQELYRELYDILNDENMCADNNNDRNTPNQDPYPTLTPAEADAVNRLMGYRNYFHLWNSDKSKKPVWVRSVVDQLMLDTTGIEKVIAAMQYYLDFKHRGIGCVYVDQSRCLVDIGAYTSIIEILKVYLSDKSAKSSSTKRPYKLTLQQIGSNNVSKRNAVIERYIYGSNTSMDAVIYYWKSLDRDCRREELNRLSLRVPNPKHFKSTEDHMRAIAIFTTLNAIDWEMNEYEQ